MATLVLEQDESVRMIETQAVQVNSDVENGYVRVSHSFTLALLIE
jgi:t-SNARE complex subunit (syntaxin)